MTGTDRYLGIAALISLAIFLYILGTFVREPDLIIVLVIGVVMAVYDFWLELFRGKAKKGDADAG